MAIFLEDLAETDLCRIGHTLVKVVVDAAVVEIWRVDGVSAPSQFLGEGENLAVLRLRVMKQ